MYMIRLKDTMLDKATLVISCCLQLVKNIEVHVKPKALHEMLVHYPLGLMCRLETKHEDLHGF